MSVSACLQDLLSRRFSGQYDTRIGYSETNAMLSSLQWSGIADFLSSPKMVWRCEREVAGYVKVCGPLTHVVVVGGGHVAARERPRQCLDMLHSFIADAPWTSNGRKRKEEDSPDSASQCAGMDGRISCD